MSNGFGLPPVYIEGTTEDEVVRLRAENKSMDKIIMSLIDRLGTITSARILQGKDIAELSAKNAELSVEIDRLRAALKENS